MFNSLPQKKKRNRARDENLLSKPEVPRVPCGTDPGFGPESTILASELCLASSLSSSPNMSRLLSSSLNAAVAVDILAVEAPRSISSMDDGWFISSMDDGAWLSFVSIEASSTSGKPSRARAKRSYPAAKAKKAEKSQIDFLTRQLRYGSCKTVNNITIILCSLVS